MIQGECLMKSTMQSRLMQGQQQQSKADNEEEAG